jgi:hypothetical protein
MSMIFNNNKLTICEVLRQINDRLQEKEYSEIRDMLALAEQMAKRIVIKLREYNEKDNPDKWMDKDIKNSFDRSLKNYLSGDPNNALKILSKESYENSSDINQY